jgi:hypothetical protein
MATERQKQAARENLKKARAAQSERAKGHKVKSHPQGMSTADKNRLSAKTFAFPKQRKEPLNDASHVRNAIARFAQVEGVTESERDQAWRNIRAAAQRYGVEVSEDDWRELFGGRGH